MADKPTRKHRRTLAAYATLAGLTIVLLVAALMLPSRAAQETLTPEELYPGVLHPEPVAEDAPVSPEAEELPGVAAALPDARAVPEPGAAGSLYFVIDDAGYNMEQLEPFLRFPGAVTIAVLPQLPYSTPAALAALSAGKEVILHQPMEAESGKDPGPGAIYVGDSAEHIQSVLAENLATVPGAVGMNNHMGSRATSDRVTMEAVLLDAARRNLYFLDSRTAVSTVVAETARSLGLRILERNVFLDNDPDRDSIEFAIREGMELASRRGHAVMIGHVMVSELAEALHDLYPEMLEQGYELLPLSQLLTNGRDDALPGHAHTGD